LARPCNNHYTTPTSCFIMISKPKMIVKPNYEKNI